MKKQVTLSGEERMVSFLKYSLVDGVEEVEMVEEVEVVEGSLRCPELVEGRRPELALP